MRQSRSLIAALKNHSATRPPARRISLIRAAPQQRHIGPRGAAANLLRSLSDAPRFANGAPLADSNKINPWTAVRFENSKTILNADSATAMGEYYFTTLEGTVAKVEYTFQYKRGADGNLKIVVHHSSLPYSP